MSDALLQKIAAENNLAETAFYVNEGDYYHLRWFTPTVEVDLCGHATLAAAFVIFTEENFNGDKILFKTRSGELSVKKEGSFLTLDFPADEVKEISLTEDLVKCFDVKAQRAFRGRSDIMLIFENEEEIRNIQPNVPNIQNVNSRGIIVTARGENVDFVSRFFAPNVGVSEDPVTGSAHTTLIPFWAKELNKTELSARQLSSRGGSLYCRMLGDRVEISGHAHLYLKGNIYLP